MDYLMHHGIKGQKWGVRRWQNSDGTLTSEGKQRYHQKIDRDARLAKGLTTSFGAYGGLVTGLAMTAFMANPVSMAAITAGATFAGAVASSALTYGDINFKRDEAHMYVESGKYFMQRSVNVNRH